MRTIPSPTGKGRIKAPPWAPMLKDPLDAQDFPIRLTLEDLRRVGEVIPSHQLISRQDIPLNDHLSGDREVEVAVHGLGVNMPYFVWDLRTSTAKAPVIRKIPTIDKL